MTFNFRLSILLLIYLGARPTAYSQEIIASGGDHFENTSGSISWTIGKLAHETLSSDALILSQGFHQPEVVINGIADLPRLGIQLRAYPNPAGERLQLEFTKGFQSRTFSVQIIDLFGRRHLEQNLNDPLTEIDCRNLPGGSYLLRIQGNGQAVHTFKVIKLR